MALLMVVKTRGKEVYKVTSNCGDKQRHYDIYSDDNYITTYTLKENAFIFATEKALKEYNGNIEVHYIEQNEILIYRDYALFEDIRNKG